MTKRILVGVDGSEQSRHALEHALETFEGASVTALFVVESPDIVDADSDLEKEIHADLQGRAESVLREAEAIADEHGVDISVAKTADAPARGIIEYAAENGFDQIVVGSHGRTGAQRVLLGSIAERVVRRSPVPVTVVRS